MSITTVHSGQAASSLRGLLPAWVGAAVYVVMVLAGNRLLADPDTQWQLTVGQWIIDHHAVPTEDIYSFTMRGQPWTSTQWLAQVMYAKAFALGGWAGTVALAAGAIALTFALLARFVSRRLSESATLLFVSAALALSASHLLARPHVLALPVLVAWAAGLVAAADRREAPSWWLLPLMTLWANLHGGFVFGLMLIGGLALDAVSGVDRARRWPLFLRWFVFGLAALAASCITPYGWNALLAAQKILSLGSALPLITEWRPADFGSIGPLEICLLLGAGLALYRGITLPVMRIVLLLGLVHMALAQVRASEILALIAPLVLAAPLARQIGGAEVSTVAAAPIRGALVAGLAAALMAGTVAYASLHRFEPPVRSSPVAAVTELKKLNLARVLNDYDFGGYLIANGVAPFIDGRTELYGEKFFVDHNAFSSPIEPDNLFRLLEQYDIEATLLRTQSAAAKLLDRVDGWQKIYSDDITTIHLRKPGAVHTVAPAVSATKN
jgi:hypothetical protein